MKIAKEIWQIKDYSKTIVRESLWQKACVRKLAKESLWKNARDRKLVKKIVQERFWKRDWKTYWKLKIERERLRWCGVIFYHLPPLLMRQKKNGLWTDQRTVRRTDGETDGQTDGWWYEEIHLFTFFKNTAEIHRIWGIGKKNHNAINLLTICLYL